MHISFHFSDNLLSIYFSDNSLSTHFSDNFISIHHTNTFKKQGSHGVGKSGKGMELNFDNSRPGNSLEFHIVVGKCR